MKIKKITNVMMIKVETDKAPKALGPYSQAVEEGGFVFCSGQISPEGDTATQCRQVLENLKAVLEAAGSGLERVVKTTIYLIDMSDFGAVNEVYGCYFTGEVKPARATVAVSALPKGAKVEIDCVARCN